MKKKLGLFNFLICLLFLSGVVWGQSTLNCKTCHGNKVTMWQNSAHGNTQLDVASELAEEWKGNTPSEVIQNEDCIACHGAMAIKANGGMSEADALAYFFTTTNGKFTDTTKAIHQSEWPNNACVTCHDVPSDHPNTMPTLKIFDSRTAQYNLVNNSTSQLCGQCHGNLRFADTDHLKFNAWQASKHGRGGQTDVAGELGEEWAGVSPDSVINGVDGEDCIACHAPTSVLQNGGISEAEALGMFFTTNNGKFDSQTKPANTDAWPEVACITCHNPHNPGAISYFNSATRKYETLNSSNELCGKCHGNLRFADTDHLSYNIEQGTGGKGVVDLQTMPGIKCVDCHMYTIDVDDSKALMFGGHSWQVFVTEDDGSESSACTNCHSTMDAKAAKAKIEDWKTEFSKLDSTANEKINSAQAKLSGSNNSQLLSYLKEAQFNLAFAESDESQGVHNHKYSRALLEDAINKANLILTGVNDNSIIVNKFELYQNYPNPFNPTTIIKFSLDKEQKVSLNIYNMLGKLVKNLVNGTLSAGNHSVTFTADNLSTGIYFYSLRGEEGRIITRKLVLLK